MPVYCFQGITPVVDRSSFVHPTASLIGDVLIGPGCFIGPGASLRGDFGRITIVGDTSIQDCCVIHTSSESDCTVGRGATVGHGAVLHGCTIGENALVGINAVILDHAQIGAECLIGALSMVKSDMQVPPRSLVAGNPAKVLKQFLPEQVTWRNDGDGEYQRLARDALAQLIACQPLAEAEAGRPRVRSNAYAVRLRAASAVEQSRRTAPTSTPSSEKPE